MVKINYINLIKIGFKKCKLVKILLKFGKRMVKMSTKISTIWYKFSIFEQKKGNKLVKIISERLDIEAPRGPGDLEAHPPDDHLQDVLVDLGLRRQRGDLGGRGRGRLDLAHCGPGQLQVPSDTFIARRRR